MTWRDRKGRDLKGEKIPCWDNRLRGKGFEEEGIRRIWIFLLRI